MIDTGLSIEVCGLSGLLVDKRVLVKYVILLKGSKNI